MEIPEWVADNEEGNIRGVSVGEDGVAGGLDHFPVCDYDFTAIEFLLLTKTNILSDLHKANQNTKCAKKCKSKTNILASPSRS